MESKVHSIVEMLKTHWSEFAEQKEEHADLDPLTFNRKYGLYIDPPSTWPTIEAVVSTCFGASPEDSVLIIYPTTQSYKDVSKLFSWYSENAQASHPSNVSFISWHEIFSAMSRVSEDARILKRIKERLVDANLVFFLGASEAISDVINQVRGYCDGCLIIIG